MVVLLVVVGCLLLGNAMIFFSARVALVEVLIGDLDICNGFSLLVFGRIGACMLLRVPAKNAWVC